MAVVRIVVEVVLEIKKSFGWRDLRRKRVNNAAKTRLANATNSFHCLKIPWALCNFDIGQRIQTQIDISKLPKF